MSEEKYLYYTERIRTLEEEGALRHLEPLHLAGKYVEVAGQRLLNLSGNSYLGLPETLPADTPAFDASRYPFSSASSRLLSGNDEIYSAFERTLCNAYEAESALVWSSGYHANSGAIPVLCDHTSLILADRLVHASIIEGIKLSGARFTRFRHNDIQHLATLLEKEAPLYDRVWIITESIYSMDGDVAPLEAIVALKKLYLNVFLYVDEAHGVGVIGERGLGLADQLGLGREVDFLVGTLGKALGSVGAYTLQNDALRTLMISTARPFIFNTALPPVNVAWSEHLFRAMMQMNDKRLHLRSLAQLLICELALPIARPSHIIPVIIPGVEACSRVAKRLRVEGFYVRPIRKPTVPAGSERIRLSLSAAMTREEILRLAAALKKYRSNP